MNVRIAVSIAIVLGAVHASAQDQSSRPLPTAPPRAVLINDVDEATVARHPLSRYLENSSAIVVDIDLTKVEPTEIAKWVGELVSTVSPNAEEVRRGDIEKGSDGATFPNDAATRQQIAIAEGVVGAFRNAGVEHLYLSAAARSWVDGGPLLVIPCENSAAVNGLVSMALVALPKEPPQRTWIESVVFVAGPRAAIDRVRQQEPVTRGDLILPLTSPDRLDHMIVISPPRDTREELAAIWPDRLPDSVWVRLLPPRLARDVTRVLIEWSLPPEPEARVTILASDPESSRRIVLQLDRLQETFAATDSLVNVTVDDASVRVELRVDAAVDLARQTITRSTDTRRPAAPSIRTETRE